MEQLSAAQTQGLYSTLRFIEHNLHTPLNLESIAAVSPWSRWQLQRIVVAATGMTLAQYVRELRLSQAAKDLLNSEHRQLDIALSNGFDSEVSFSRSFRQFFSCSPGQYRRRGILTGIRLPLTRTNLNPVRIDFKAAFDLLGYCQKTRGLHSDNPDFHKVVPDTWQRAIKENPSWLQQTSSLYGAFYSDSKHSSTDFTYWAGIEKPACEADRSENVLSLPDQTYAVITHRNSLTTFSSTVEWMLDQWLPNSGLHYSAGTDLESYPTQAGPIKQQCAEYWLPIISP